jgi:hypothetical protein
VLAAVNQFGLSLFYASEELKSDKEVVLAAVKQNGNALLYASDDIKSDKEVMLEAVIQDENALYFVSDDLKSDKDVVFAAASQDLYAIRHSLLSKEEKDEIIDEIKNPLTKSAAKAETPKSDATLVSTFSSVFHSASAAIAPAAQAVEEQSVAQPSLSS